MENTVNRQKRISKLKERAFIYGHIVIPLVHFVIMFVLVKVDSFTLAFQKYQTGAYVSNGFNNFKQIFSEFLTGDKLLLLMLLNSIAIFLAGLATLPIPLFAAYLIWKNIPFSNVFKVILFLPSIIPGMVSALSFKYLVGLGFPEIFNNHAAAGLITNPNTTNYTLFIYNLWIGLGGGLVVYLGAMSGVDQSLIEYGRLDGVNLFGEFWHIVLPKIWPTMIALIVARFAGLFVADVGLYSFFRERLFNSSVSNIGYHMSVLTLRGSTNYPFLSALGLLISVFTIPIVFFVKWLLEKLGPSEA